MQYRKIHRLQVDQVGEPIPVFTVVVEVELPLFPETTCNTEKVIDTHQVDK